MNIFDLYQGLRDKTLTTFHRPMMEREAGRKLPVPGTMTII